jgi:hypothetical protein
MPRQLALPLVLLTLLGQARPARADEPQDPNAVRYSFEDDKVLADTVGPLGEVMSVRKRPERESLVRARSSFVVALLQSVEAL